MASWWQKEGVRFKCQGSGNCCVSRGEYGYVFLTLADRKALAKALKLTLKEFTADHCVSIDGHWSLREEPGHPECRFLKNNRCQVYKARPTQCRTWPFWPENMGAKTWKKEVASFCPGVGLGPLIPPIKVQALLKEQKQSELDLDSEASAP